MTEKLRCFSQTLKDLLAENDLSIKDFSDKIDIKQSRIYDFLNEKHFPSLQNAIKITDFFSCSLDYLFGFVTEYAPQAFKTTNSVTEQINTAIQQSGVSRYQLSQKTKISQPQLCRYANGDTTPTLTTLLVLAESLSCSLDFLAGRA